MAFGGPPGFPPFGFGPPPIGFPLAAYGGNPMGPNSVEQLVVSAEVLVAHLVVPVVSVGDLVAHLAALAVSVEDLGVHQEVQVQAAPAKMLVENLLRVKKQKNRLN